MDLTGRLKRISQKDKQNNPKYLIDVIKSDYFCLINNFFEVAFEDIDVKINLQDNFYSIEIKCLGERLKNFKALPD